MLVRTLKVSDKGQITLPADALRAMHARRGTEFLVVQEGNRLILVKAEEIGTQVIDELAGFEALGLSSFTRMWENEADSIWDDA